MADTSACRCSGSGASADAKKGVSCQAPPVEICEHSGVLLGARFGQLRSRVAKRFEQRRDVALGQSSHELIDGAAIFGRSLCLVEARNL
eukprot:1568762-Prymnesium_polylepis.1